MTMKASVSVSDLPPADYGTPELSRRHEVKPRLIGRGHAVHLVVTDQRMIDRMLQTGRITAEEHQVAEAVTRLLERAGMVGVGAQNLDASPSGEASPISLRLAVARQEMSAMIRWLDRRPGKAGREQLVKLALDDAPIRRGPPLVLLRATLASVIVFWSDWRGERIRQVRPLLGPSDALVAARAAKAVLIR